MSYDYIALFHPTGKLWMFHENNEYIFVFTDLYDHARDILNIAAKSLSMKNRFSGMCSAPISVLRHSYLIGLCLLDDDDASSREVLIGFMHDIGEAFYADVPRPFKSEDDRKKEQAILRAMSWKFLHEEMPPIVKKWDNIALYCEAKEYGHPGWTWPEELRESIGMKEEEINAYKKMMNVYKIVKDESLIDCWINIINTMVETYEKDPI